MQPGGQSIVDRLLAAKNTIAGQAVAKVVCKATTEEIMGPKRKHLDCKLNISIQIKMISFSFCIVSVFYENFLYERRKQEKKQQQQQQQKFC